MNAMTTPVFAAPVRTARRERRRQVRVPTSERRHDKAEQQASAALAMQLREVREHSYLSAPAPRFRVC